jgi:O-antigen/teichoic acid export membrane protein
VGLALLGLLQNVDVILLGRLDHADIGPYAAISVASKALVFGALALGAYLLPEATIRWNEGGHAIRQLGVTLIFLAVPAVVLLAIAVLVPKQFLTLVFGARLSSAAPAFATLVVAMMFLSGSVLVTNYLFGTGSRWIVLVLLGGSALATVLISGADGQIEATARADLVAQGALALAMAAAFAALHLRRGRHGGGPRRRGSGSGWPEPPGTHEPGSTDRQLDEVGPSTTPSPPRAGGR